MTNKDERAHLWTGRGIVRLPAFIGLLFDVARDELLQRLDAIALAQTCFLLVVALQIGLQNGVLCFVRT